MNTAIVTIADLVIGDTGKIVTGKFGGREFRVRALGTQGRTVLVSWHGSADTGSIRATTQVEIEVGDGVCVGAVVEFREDTPQFAKNQGIRYVVVSSPLGDNASEMDGESYVWLVHQDDITKAPSRRRIRSGYVSALRVISPEPRTDMHDAIAAAEARCDVLLSAQNPFAVGDTVRCTLPEFAGSEWSKPMTVEQIVPNHPLAKPVYARTASGAVGAFSPADLEAVR